MDGVIDAKTHVRRRPRAGGGDLDYVTGVESGESPPSIKVAHADLLYEAAAELLRADDQAEVLGIAVRHAARMLKTHIAFVMLLDPSGKVLKLEASTGHRTPTFTTIVRPVQAITAVGTGKPVQSSDFLNDSRLDHDPSTDDIVRKEGMRTVLAVPLQHGERMLGALYAGHREPRHFPQGEVENFLALAKHVSNALAHIQHAAQLTAQLETTSRSWRESDRRLAALTGAEELTGAALNRIRDLDGVAAVTVALAEVLDRPVLVTDWKLTPIAQGGGRSNAAVLNRSESRAAVAACAQTHRPVDAGRDWKVAPIEAGRTLVGYVWVGPPNQSGQSSAIELVIERLTPILALEVFTKGDADRRQRGDFIYEFLAERRSDDAVLEARASSFWTHFNQPHRPLVMRVTGPQDQWGTRLETARRLVAATRPNDLVAIYGRHLVVLMSPASREQVEESLTDIAQALGRSHLSASVVVGGQCRDLRASREATLAALKLDDLLATSGVLWVEGLEALTYLFDGEHKDRLEAMCRAALAPFGRRDGLLDAVHAYYEAGGNRASAARRLSIHVNTLRQRIERAEQILGGSIDESVRAVPLRLALLVRQVSRAGVATAHN